MRHCDTPGNGKAHQNPALVLCTFLIHNNLIFYTILQPVNFR
jgi:hypothetical protein